MSLLSHNELVKLVESGVIDVKPENINGASIDITLGDEIMFEGGGALVDLKNKESLNMCPYQLPEIGHCLCPGDFILATSRETFNLPNNIAAEYKLKSSLARCGLQHLLAGWCDPGWNNSKLTLELTNLTRMHTLVIKPGMKIGQMVFWKCDPVPDEESYAVKGQYNDQKTVTENKGVR
jgi:dCTP deaminase